MDHLFGLNFFNARHPRSKDFWNGDAAVSVLVVFENGDEGAANGDGGAV